MFRQISIKHLHNYSWKSNIFYSLTIHSGAISDGSVSSSSILVWGVVGVANVKLML